MPDSSPPRGRGFIHYFGGVSPPHRKMGVGFAHHFKGLYTFEWGTVSRGCYFWMRWLLFYMRGYSRCCPLFRRATPWYNRSKLRPKPTPLFLVGRSQVPIMTAEATPTWSEGVATPIFGKIRGIQIVPLPTDADFLKDTV